MLQQPSRCQPVRGSIEHGARSVPRTLILSCMRVGYLLEDINPCPYNYSASNFTANDKSLDFRSTFVDLEDLCGSHQSSNRIFLRVTISTKNLYGINSNFSCNISAKTLGMRSCLGMRLLSICKLCRFPYIHSPRLIICLHIGEFCHNHLVIENWFTKSLSL